MAWRGTSRRRLLAPLCCLAGLMGPAGCMDAENAEGLTPLKGSVEEAWQVAALSTEAEGAAPGGEASGGEAPGGEATSPIATDTEAAVNPEPPPAAAADGGALAPLGDADASPPEPQAAVVIEPPALRRPRGQSWAALGLRLLASGDYVQAERAFNRAMAGGDVRRETLAGMGIAAAGQGHVARAERFLRAALVIAPEDADTHAALGALLVQKGEYEAARSHLRTAFVVSSGQHPIAGQHLALVEARLAAALPNDVEAEEAVAFRTERTGRSEYRLVSLDIAEAAAAAAAEEGGPGTEPAAPVPAVAALLEELPEADRTGPGEPETAAEPDPSAETAPVTAETAQSVPNGETGASKDDKVSITNATDAGAKTGAEASAPVDP